MNERVHELITQYCDACALHVFPRRYRCPVCGASTLVSVAVTDGILEHVTRLANRDSGCDVVIGSAVLESGSSIIVRVEGALAAGQPASLFADGNVPIARRGRA
jgi:uncharacterized OB-fold protein